MYRKLLLSLITLLVIFNTTACKMQNKPITTNAEEREITNQITTSQVQETTEQDVTNETASNVKEVLELEDLSRRVIFPDFEEGNLPERKSIALPHYALNEINNYYNNEEELNVLVKYI